MEWKQLTSLSIKGIRGYFLIEKPRYFLGNYLCYLGLLSTTAYSQQKGEVKRMYITKLRGRVHKWLENCEAPLESSFPGLPFLGYYQSRMGFNRSHVITYFLFMPHLHAPKRYMLEWQYWGESYIQKATKIQQSSKDKNSFGKTLLFVT